MSTIGIWIALTMASAAFLMWAVVRSLSPRPARIAAPSHPSALDEAERILTARYASGDITPGEYRKALAVLRT